MFIYIDNSQKPPKVIFKSDKESISKADEEYNKFFGVDVIKQFHIGCFKPEWKVGFKYDQ